MYGNIISKNKDNIKSKKIFFAIYRIAYKTIGTQIADVAAGSHEYADGHVDTEYIQLVFERDKPNIIECILLFADIYKIADGEIRGVNNPKGSRAHRRKTIEIADIAPT